MFRHRFPHPRSIRICTAAFLVFGLSSCAETEWPQWLSGEPSKAELDSYSGPLVMPATSAEEKEWPNLADVPPRPTRTMPAREVEAIKTELKTKNAEGQTVIENFQKEMAPPPPPQKPKSVKPKQKKKKKAKQ